MGSGLCLFCKNLIRDPQADELVCQAYPAGIPRPIVLGEIVHNEVRPDQNGDYVLDPNEPGVFAKLFPEVPLTQHTH